MLLQTVLTILLQIRLLNSCRPGQYSIKLTVSNTHGVDSMKLTNAFQAGTTINVGVNSLPAGESCFCNFDHFIAFASGATELCLECAARQ